MSHVTHHAARVARDRAMLESSAAEHRSAVARKYLDETTAEERDAYMAEEREVREAQAAVEAAQRRLDHVQRYTTEALIAKVAEGEVEATGLTRAAAHLLRLPTPALRSRAVSHADAVINLAPSGRYSDEVKAAVVLLLGMLETGRIDEETWAEREVRVRREVDLASRFPGGL